MPYAILQVETLNGAQFRTVSDVVDEEVEGAILCSPNTQIGDVFDGWSGFMARAGVLSGKPARAVEDARAEAIAQIEHVARDKRISIAGTDSSKRDVYSIKYEIAVAALQWDQAALNALTPEATSRGETPEQLAALVKRLGDQWRAAALAIDAAYQTHKARVLALQSIEEIDAYDSSTGWPF